MSTRNVCDKTRDPNRKPAPVEAKKHGNARDLRVNTKRESKPSQDAVRGDQARPVNRAARGLEQNR